MPKTQQKTKTTNIPWLGDIPEGWEVVPLKKYFNFEKGKNAQNYTAEYCGSNIGEYPVFSGQTENGGIMGKINSYEYETAENLFVTTVGAKAMDLKIIKGKYSLSQNCALIKPVSTGINIFFYYFLISVLFDYEKGLISTIMQPSLRFEDLVKYKIPLPPLPTQIVIVEFLDQKTQKIEEFIKNKKELIKLLKEQKKSLIYDTVTKGLDKNVKLKSSEVVWLGDIPEGWEIIKFKYLYNSSMGATILANDLVENGKIPVYSATESDKIFGYVNETPVILTKNDLVIPARGNSIGNLMIVNDEIATSTQTTIYALLRKCMTDCKL